MTSVLFSSVSAQPEDMTGGYQWRENMRTLWQYGRRDMRDAKVQEKRLYPKNWEKHVIRPVPFVWSIGRELATAYRRKPTRRFVGLDGKPLSPETVKLIEAEYKRARVNRVMRNAHYQLCYMNNATVWVQPNSTRTGCNLRLIPPHEQEVMLRPFAVDEDDVDWWRYRVALPMAPDPTMFTMAVAKISTTEAIWEHAPAALQGRGLYMQDGSNPWGMIPVACLRGTEPGEGEWWAPCPEDILGAQRAINHDLTDVGTIARLQGFGQAKIKSINPKDFELETGPETAVGITDPNGDFDYARGQPDLDGYINQSKEYAVTTVAANGLSPASFAKSPALTALAKQMEMIDRENYREEQIEPLLAAEQRIYDIMRAQMNWMRGGVEVWPAAIVEVEYREPQLPADPLHDAQALDLRIKRRQTSEVKARALHDGVPEEEARKRIEAEIVEQRELDKLAGVVTETPEPDHGAAPGATETPEDGTETQTPAPTEGSPPALAAEGEVQKAALNGAQVAELRGTIQAVADGLLPAGSARAIILAAYPIAPADVDAMLTPMAGFEAKKPEPAPAPFGAPKPVEDEPEDVAT